MPPRLGAILQGMVSPQVAPGSSYRGAANALGEFGQQMQQKRQQDRYFQLQQEQYAEPKRREALQRIQAALTNPDDPAALQAAIAEGKRWGIDVQGAESLIPAQARERVQRDYQAGAAPDEPMFEVEGETSPEAQEAPATAQEQTVPDWLNQYMGGQGVQSERGKQIQSETENELGELDTEPNPETRAVAASVPNPEPVQPRSFGTLGEGLGGLRQKPRGVTITLDGKPYASFDANDLEGYRAKQSMLVGAVFEPLVTNAADDTEKRAATVAQRQAIESYNAGMSKEQAIELGNKVWTQLIGMRFKRDYTKFPPGWKPAMPGGGGAPMSDKQAIAVWDKLSDNDRAWIAEARHEYKLGGAQQAVADSGLIEAATNAETPLAQNQGLMRILKEMSGTAVTNTEAQRFYEGIGIFGQAENLLRRIAGGDISQATRDGVREIAGLVRARARGQINSAGNFVHDQVMSDFSSPETDEQRVYHARRMRSLVTGESIEPMRKGKKGKLEAVKTGEAAPAPTTEKKTGVARAKELLPP